MRGMVLATMVGLAGILPPLSAFAARAVPESAREIPVACEVDVVVVGGSTGGVAAAVAAAENGADVFLAAPRPYLGEDMTATLRLWFEEGEEPTSELGKKIFSEGRLARPLHIKKTLDEALLDAGVDFLYSSYATDVLRDADGNPAGIVMANRSGRQAVVAKVIIDATDRGWVARMAGAEFSDFPGGVQALERVVIGGEVREGDDMTARKIEPGFTYKDKTYDVIEYSLEIPVKDNTFASWAKAEQIARDMTYHPDQQFASDVLFQVPPERMKGAKSVSGERWSGEEGSDPLPDLAAFRPKGVSRLLVVSGVADVPREMAARLLRPLRLIDMGVRIGEAAAKEARKLPAPEKPGIPAEPVEIDSFGDVRETLAGIRPFEEYPTVPQGERALPVLGRYDVVVIGGGTSGAPAGIAAGRKGAKTLVVEYLYGLGGVGTHGAIAGYYHGYRGGFTKEVADGQGRWKIEPKMEWWRTTLRNAGAEIWFGVLGCGAVVDRGKVVGAVVATPQGRGVVLADIVVDSTGNADVAAAAGATCRYTDASDIAMQGTGLPPRELGASYRNTDFTITDETDMTDITSLFVYAKSKYPKDAFDAGQLIDTRERRTIVGDYTLTILDQLNDRTFQDTIGQSKTNFDTHGYTVHPLFTLRHPDKSVSVRCYTPYRCLLPKGLDGILVTGLGVSAHRDAIPLIRMQPDLQNQGYAAGVAAAMAAKEDLGTRSINIRELQKHLVEIGNLPESVLTDEDSYPLPAETIAEAVQAARRREVVAAERALKTVHFDYRSASLTDSARRILDENVKWLRDHSDVRIEIAGHCDERGARQYNRMFGKRRAENVAQYLIDKGIDRKRLRTVSYGEERPVDPGHNETAWRKNRRVEFARVETRDLRPEEVAVILSHAEQALPLLREAYAKATKDEDRLTYAHILAMLGDATGLETLIDAVEAHSQWDKGWNFRGMGQFGANLSPLDSLIVALGTTGDRRATPVILERMKSLDASKDFSHHRAVALALERLGDPAAADALAELLAKPGMSGNAMTTIENARSRHVKAKEGLNALQPRRESLREIMLARALVRCGDKDGAGRKILEAYRKDIRGHFARHADAVLKEAAR